MSPSGLAQGPGLPTAVAPAIDAAPALIPPHLGCVLAGATAKSGAAHSGMELTDTEVTASRSASRAASEAPPPQVATMLTAMAVSGR